MSSKVEDSDDTMYYWVQSPIKPMETRAETRKKRKFEEEMVINQGFHMKKSKKSHETNEKTSFTKISPRNLIKSATEAAVKPRKPRSSNQKNMEPVKSRNSKQKITKSKTTNSKSKQLKSAQPSARKSPNNVSEQASGSRRKKEDVTVIKSIKTKSSKGKKTPKNEDNSDPENSGYFIVSEESENSTKVHDHQKHESTAKTEKPLSKPAKKETKKSPKQEKKLRVDTPKPKVVKKREKSDSQVKKPRKKKEPKTPVMVVDQEGVSKEKENQQPNTTVEDGNTLIQPTPSETVKEIIQYKHPWEDPNWLGNEDENGSVASGVLEEDYCVECGQSTLNNLSTNDVILCDICDGEYHLKCLGLDRIPRSTFVCKKCLEEQEQQRTLKFNVSDTFKIPKLRVTDRKVIYTPARPLETAWAECKSKGLMTVSNVFSYEIMKYLTHGTIENRTTSGRVIDTWRGATYEIASRLESNCYNLVDREGRFDLKIPQFVIEQLKLNEILEPIFERLRTIMGMNPPPKVRTHDIVFVPVGSKCQKWHTDDDFAKKKATKHRYFTVLIQLNSIDSNCGGTEVWVDKMNRGDLIRCRPGDALVFNGQLLHRGQANEGYTHRFFYYCSFSCDADMNDASME